MEVDGFRELLQHAEQLTADMDSGSDLPNVERNLAQILEAGHRLVAKAIPNMPDNCDVKASLLLSGKGYELPRVHDKLDSLKSLTAFDPVDPVADTDIQGFLKNERENALLSVIEQTRKRTFDELEQHQWECQQDEWEREKQKILNTLLGSGPEAPNYHHESHVKFVTHYHDMLLAYLSMILTAIFGLKSSLSNGDFTPLRSHLGDNELAYAKQVFEYNEHVLSNSVRPNLAVLMLDVAHTIDDKVLLDFWEIIVAMTSVPLTSKHGSDPCSVRCHPDMQRLLVREAVMHLESSFQQYMRTLVYKNLERCQLGGIPGTYHLVRSYLNLQPVTVVAEDGDWEGQPVWAMLYYCMRCGDLEAAQQLVENVSHRLGEFPLYFHEYMSHPHHHLCVASDAKIKLQYRRAVKQSKDIFKRAVFCLVGSCDCHDDHSEISDKVDDYLWIKLSQLTFDHDYSDPNRLSLEQLQKLLYEDYGEAHFNGYQNPMLYTQVLVLTGQFEAAIEFLSRIDHLRHHAVHMALVLQQSSLLIQLTPSSCHTPMISQQDGDPPCVRRINLPLLVLMYTRKFAPTDAQEAVNYLFFLRSLKTVTGKDLFLSCLSDLVLETREFEMILGRLDNDGFRQPGLVDKFCENINEVIEQVANDTATKGLTEQAVSLYDLTDNHDKAVGLMSSMLSRVVSLPNNSTQGSRHRLNMMAVSMAQRYRICGHKMTASNAKTFFLLLDLITFFDQCHVSSTSQALETVKQLQLLPFQTTDTDHYINEFRGYSEEIRRNVPDVLLATMSLLHKQYTQTRNSNVNGTRSGQFGTTDGGKETFLTSLRLQAKTLITFAGMLPYRLPGDVSSRLVQAEISMLG